MSHLDGAHKIHLDIAHSKDVFESGLNEARLQCYPYHTLQCHSMNLNTQLQNIQSAFTSAHIGTTLHYSS